MPVSTEPASTTSASPTTVIMQSNPIQPALLPDPQQGEQAIVAWLAKLSDFCHNRLPEHQHEERPETSFYTFSSKEADAIKLLLASLNCDGDSKADKRVIKWYPNYGCFLIRERRDGVVVLLTLVSLDGWTLESSTGGSAARSLSEAAAGTFSLMSCGLVPAGIVTNLLSQVDTLLSNAHSSQSELGKHLSKIPRFSPSVVHLAIKIAIVKEGKISDNEPTYQGGTTDIGKTPDHRPSRETAFPLVYVACINIVKNVILAQRVFFHIHIHDIDQEIGAIEGRPETGALRSSVDRIFHALERVAETLFDYQQLGLDIKPGVDRVSAMRGRLDAVMDSFGKTLEARYKFDVQSLVSITKQPELRNFQTITRAVADDDADPRAADHAAIAQAVRKRALEEIEVITPFYMPGADLRRMFRNVLSWIQRVKGSGTSISYIMAHIEHFMMAQARLLKEPVVPDEWIEEEGEALRSLMEEYQALYAQRSALADFAHLLLPRQRSLRVLVTWIAFAMFHKAGLQICPLLSGYGVAIDYHDLRVLVLDQDHALEALALVTEYLRSHDIPERRVFSTRHRDDQANNNAFAVEFSRTSNEIQAFWKHECDQASQRAAQHYEEVRKKVNEANRIREKITSTSSRLAEAEEIPYGMRTHSDDNRISSLSGNLSRLRSDLNETLKTPRSVINPFPSREDLALPIIFNYLMPRYLVRLAEAGFIAQNTLRPENSQISGDNRNLVEMECKLSDHTSWTYHTNSRSNRAAHLPGLPRVVYAATSTIQPPKKVGPASVDSIHSPGQCSWFPEQETVLMWRNGNPFGLSRHSITMGFIDGIGRDMSCFSWMISYPADPNAQKECARGNYAVAELHKRPVSLEKRSFLAMGGLRSYPHQQFRKLFLALSDRVMPLDNEAAQRLIRQTIYQVGELSNHIAPEMVWRRDLVDNQGLGGFRQVLADYVEEIAEKPRDHQKILILGEISAYLSNFDDAFCDLCRQFGSIAGDWANQAKDMFESETSTSLAVLNEHQGRESLMLCYAILCSVLGRIASVDIKNYCRWVVRLYYCSIFVENAKVENAAAIRKLKTQCREAISRRLLAISDLVNARRNEALTYAVQSVFENAPDDLDWRAVPDSVACFEAAHQRDHYAVNIFTGRVVLNGNPPGRLPKAVLNDDLYRRSFGNRDFEVGVDATGQVYRSVRTVHGRFYAFELMHTGVAIYEIKPDRCCEGPAVEANGSAEWIARRAAINAPPADQVLQLIDPSASRSWTTTLPVRMLSGHSFWRHRESDSVLARGVPFEDRNVSFLAKPEGCFVVPRHDKAKPLAELLELHTAFDRLISPPANVLHTLAKFEDPKFIHGHISPDHQTIRIIMPRPGVSFTLRDDVLVSDAYKGYKLAEQQQFGDLIPSFQQYLVLERMAKYGVGPRYKWIVPLGAVCIEGDVVRIQVVDKSLGTINCTDFDEHHRFGLLQASTINSRIQLAAIFAAAGTALPEPRIHMTGAEYAARLLRGCITNNPLTRSEVAMIQSIVDVARPWPFLVLLCDHLLVVSSRVSMLYQKYASKSSIDHDDRPAGYYEIIGRTFAQVQEAQTAYEHQVRSARVYNTMRRALTLTEFGFDLLDEPRHLDAGRDRVIDRSPDDQDRMYFEYIASILASYVQERPCQRANEIYPLDAHGTNSIENRILSELETSWTRYMSRRDVVARAEADELLREFIASTLLPQVTKRREDVEALVWSHTTHRVCHGSVVLELCKAVNWIPAATLADLVRASFDRVTLERLAPTLTPESVDLLQSWIVFGMKLSVLEDKLNRLLVCDRSHLGQELIYIQHPIKDCNRMWLAFEVEQGIQIRREQYQMAKHLIENPGSISQLNMGLGKTRVIVPMMILYWSAHARETLRVYVLRALLSEVRKYLHRTLSASSVFCIGIVHLPFHRRVQTTHDTIQCMKSIWKVCRDSGAVVVLSPEHSLSLQLKIHETRFAQDHELSSSLKKLVGNINKNCIDLFDESDALLHHKYQLVYAMGSPSSLESVTIREMVIEAVLRAINDNPHILTRSDNMAVESVYERPHLQHAVGYFRAFRLLPMSPKSEIRATFRREVVEALFADPPYELEWVRSLDDAETIQRLVSYICDSTISAESLAEDRIGHETLVRHWNQVLMLRGLLAHGVLEHCLELRYRVDYGLTPLSMSRMAIPFKAADVPSERSEFSHPDVCLTLTALSYYQNGLTQQQLVEAFSMLLKLGPSAQTYRYNRMLKPIKEHLATCDYDLRRSIDNVSKLDLSNSIQRQLLYQCFSHSMELIDFWMNPCIIEADMTQYSKRLLGTPWHLCGSSPAIGFSGTNDTSLLLPLSVRQNEPEVDELLATNGKMIQLIMDRTIGLELVRSPEGEPLWRTLLDRVAERKLRAIIDTGSLLSGVSNLEAAKHLATILDPTEFMGVIFFEVNSGTDGEWKMLDIHTKSVVPKESSPISDSEAFVIFDDARTRGADMKLAADAVAALTLGLKLTKDKLVQGAGRLRQLDKNQRLWIYGSHEVAVMAGIEDAVGDCRTQAARILRWVVSNTMQVTADGLMHWARQGLYHHTTADDPDKALLDDVWDLEHMYSLPEGQASLPDVVDDHSRLLVEGSTATLSERHRGSLDNISRHCRDYGETIQVSVQEKEEECEREIQQEEDQMAEIHAQTVSVTPSSEPLWRYEDILACTNANDLARIDRLALYDMETAFNTLLAPSTRLRRLAWAYHGLASMVKFSENFVRTIQQSFKSGCWDDENANIPISLSRMVSAMVVLADGTRVVVSDREADGVLAALTANSNANAEGPWSSVALTTVQQNLAETHWWFPGHCSAELKLPIDSQLLAILRLYNGECNFPTPEQLQGIEQLIGCQGHMVEEAIRQIMLARGTTNHWDCSDLHRMFIV